MIGKFSPSPWWYVVVPLILALGLFPVGQPGAASQLHPKQEPACGASGEPGADSAAVLGGLDQDPLYRHPHAPYVPPEEQSLALLVDTRQRRLTLLVNGFPYKSWPVAVGKPESPSPPGRWRVVQKSRDWGRGFGTRWLGLNVPWGIYGIHGTNKPWSIGRRASGGCIRMRNRDVEELYELVPPGTVVWILGDPLGSRRALVPGHTGADVLAVQQRLQELGLYHGPLDGRYGPGTAAAVKALQKKEGLPVTGQVREDVYRVLGLVP